jgi:hypothetical protein
VRAAGFDNESVELALAFLPLRLPDGRLLISAARIELELVGPVMLVLRRPL